MIIEGDGHNAGLITITKYQLKNKYRGNGFKMADK